MSSSNCPSSLKGIAHYLKIAEDHDQRDLVISYWCRLYALEVAVQISANSKTPEMNKFLLTIMDWLEKVQSENTSNECITNQTCAQSYVENYSLKLFNYGDEQDQAENYGKNVVKAFYTAGILMDVLSTFGELDEEMSEKRKYAKWKAAYIHNCLKVGERPNPGSFGAKQTDFTPIDNQNASNENFPNIPSNPTIPNNASQFDYDKVLPQVPQMPQVPQIPQVPQVPQMPETGYGLPSDAMGGGAYLPQVPVPSQVSMPVVSQSGGVTLAPEQMQKAQKYCKWATSALNYDDVNTAIVNLQKALTLLQTGTDPSD